MPLWTWFWAARLLVTRPGLDSVTLASSLGLSSRQTAHAILARPRRVMAQAPLAALTGTIEADEMMVGGVTEFSFRSEFRGRPSDAFSTLLALLVNPA